MGKVAAPHAQRTGNTHSTDRPDRAAGHSPRPSRQHHRRGITQWSTRPAASLHQRRVSKMEGMQGGMGMELWAIVPELTLAGLVLILLPLGPFLPRTRKDIATWLALLGLLAVAVESAVMLFWKPQAVFLGTYAVDPFAVYFKLFAVVSKIG